METGGSIISINNILVWVDVKELKMSYYDKEALSFPTYRYMVI